MDRFTASRGSYAMILNSAAASPVDGGGPAPSSAVFTLTPIKLVNSDCDRRFAANRPYPREARLKATRGFLLTTKNRSAFAHAFQQFFKHFRLHP
jgi:hypothetical protein